MRVGVRSPPDGGRENAGCAPEAGHVAAARQHPIQNPISGWSILASWEDADLNRYFPAEPWAHSEHRVKVTVRDGCTGRLVQTLWLTKLEASAYGNNGEQ